MGCYYRLIILNCSGSPLFFLKRSFNAWERVSLLAASFKPNLRTLKSFYVSAWNNAETFSTSVAYNLSSKDKKSKPFLRRKISEASSNKKKLENIIRKMQIFYSPLATSSSPRVEKVAGCKEKNFSVNICWLFFVPEWLCSIFCCHN